MIRPINPENPARVRRDIQTRYDNYMGGRRARLGVVIPGVSIDTMGVNQEERDQAYDKLESRFPLKSKGLIKNVAREALFEGYCASNHRTHVEGLFGAMVENERMVNGAAILYLSGASRNAVWASVLVRLDEEPFIIGPSVGRAQDVTKLYGQLNLSAGLLLDSDYGMGDITGPTPEIFDVSSGSEELMKQSMLRVS